MVSALDMLKDPRIYGISTWERHGAAPLFRGKWTKRAQKQLLEKIPVPMYELRTKVETIDQKLLKGTTKRLKICKIT
jgi:hypothetical protein